MRSFTLVAFATGIAVATFVTRLWFPIDSRQVFELHVWQWPQCIAMFVLGLACAENDWLQPVPARIRRRAGISALIALVAVVVAFGVSRDSIDPFAGGMSWQAVLVAACEGVLTVGLAVWLLGFFQVHADHARPPPAAGYGTRCLRRLHHPGGRGDRAGGRSSPTGR